MAYNDFVALVREKTKKNTAAEKSAAVSAVGNPVVDRMIDYMKYQRIGYDTLGDDINSLLEGTKGYLEGGWADSNATAAQKQSVGNMISRLKSAKQYYTDHADQFSGDVSQSIAEIDRTLGALTELSGYIDKAGAGYANYGSREEYDKAISDYKFTSQYKDMSADELERIVSDLKFLKWGHDMNGNGFALHGVNQDNYSERIAHLESLLAEKQVENYVTWAKQQGDFAEKSNYVSPGVSFEKASAAQKLYMLVANPGLVYTDNVLNDDDWSFGTDEPLKQLYGLYQGINQTAELGSLLELSKDEKNTFFYLYNTGQITQAFNYFSTVKDIGGKRLSEDVNAVATKMAAEHPWLSTIAAVGTNIVLSVPNAVENIADAVTGGGYDKYSGVNLLGGATDTIYGTVPEVWAKKYGWDKDITSFIYSTGVSIAQNVGTSLLFGGYSGTKIGEIASLAAMGTQAANSTMRDLAAQGAEDWQIYALGIISGAAEMAMEKVPLENLIKIGKEGGKAGLKATLQNILKQAGTEFAEEALTETVNILADSIFRLDESELAKAVGEKGLFNALKDSIGQVIMAGASGAVSGGFMGSAFSIYGGTVGSAKYRQVGKFMVDNGAANILIEQGLKLGQGSEAYEIADLLRRRMANNKEGKLNAMSYADVGRLYALETAAVREQYMQATEKKLSVQLEAAGVKASKVEGLAAALAKAISGEQMTRSESKAIGKSAAATKILEQSQAVLDPARVAWNPIQKSTVYKIADGTMTINRMGDSNIYRVDLLPSSNAERGAGGELGDGAVRTLESQSVRQVELMVKKAAEGAGIADISSGFGEQLSSDEAAAVTMLSAELSGVNENVAGIAAGIASAMGGDLRIVFDPELSATGDTGLFRRNYDGTREAYVAPTLGGMVSTLAHELFHDIEDTAAGKAFIAAAVEYAKTQPARNPENGANRYEEVKHLYQTRKGVSDKAELETEVGAKIAGDILASEDALKAVLEHMKPQQKTSLWQRLKRALTSLKNKLKGQKNAKPAETQLNVLERLYKQAFAQRVIQDAVENPRVGDPNAVSESDAEGVTRMNEEKVQVSAEKEKADIEELQKSDKSGIMMENKKEDLNYGKENHNRFLRGNTVYSSRTTSGLRSQSEGTLRNSTQGGIHRGEGTQRVLSEDTEGRRIIESILRRLSKTAICYQGKPISLYHSTNKDFERFEIGDIGFHFGSKEQAQKRAVDKKTPNAIYVNAYLNIENPLRINRDYMNWHANSVALQLWIDGVLSEEEKNEIMSLWPQGPDYGSPAAVRLREMLESKGYDGIEYANEYEGEGSSYIAFYDEQIIRVDGTTATSSDIAAQNAQEDVFGSEKADVAEDEITDGRAWDAESRARANAAANSKYNEGKIKKWSAQDVQLLKMKAEMARSKKVFDSSELDDAVSRSLRILTPTLVTHIAGEGRELTNIRTTAAAKKLVAKALTNAFNSKTSETERRDLCRACADYLIRNTLADDMFYAEQLTETQAMASTALDVLQKYRGRIDIDFETAEAHRNGKGIKKKIAKAWLSTAPAKGFSVFEVANALAERGVTLDIDSEVWTESEVLEIIDKLYSASLDAMAENVTTSIGSPQDYSLFIGTIADELYDTYDAGGKNSTVTSLENDKNLEIAALQAEQDSEREKFKDKVKEIREKEYEKRKEYGAQVREKKRDEIAAIKAEQESTLDKIALNIDIGRLVMRVKDMQKRKKLIGALGTEEWDAVMKAAGKITPGRFVSGAAVTDFAEGFMRFLAVHAPKLLDYGKAGVAVRNDSSDAKSAASLHDRLADINKLREKAEATALPEDEEAKAITADLEMYRLMDEDAAIDVVQLANRAEWNVEPQIQKDLERRSNLIAKKEQRGLTQKEIEEISEAARERARKRELNQTELEALRNILRAVMKINSRYNQILIDDRWQDTDKYASEGIGQSDSYYGLKKQNPRSKLLDKQMKGMTPTGVFEALGGFVEDSVLVKCFDAIKKAENARTRKRMEYLKEAENFYTDEKHKKWLKHFNDDRITLQEATYDEKGKVINEAIKITVGEAMALYCTSKREHAKLGLALSKITFNGHDKRGKDVANNREFRILDVSEDIGEAEYLDLVDKNFIKIKEMIDDIYKNKLTDEDREFIEIVENFFRLSSKEKSAQDRMLTGTTNVIGSYYFPIIRSVYSRDVNIIGNDREFGSFVGVQNLPFNQNTVKNAKAPVYIMDIWDLLQKYAGDLANYVTLTVPLQNLNRIYNCRVEINGEETTMREYYEKHVWSKTSGYIRDLMHQVQGKVEGTAMDRDAHKWISRMKSNYAIYALGFNFGSYLKQKTTEFAILSSDDVTVSSWLKGMMWRPRAVDRDGAKKKWYDFQDVEGKLAQMRKYSDAAYIRQDSTELLRAAGAYAKIGRIGQKTMKLVGHGDDIATLRIMSVAQYATQQKSGYGTGTIENVMLAGDLVNKLIDEYQDTSAIATKSAYMRSGNPIVSGFTIFTSSVAKQYTRLCIKAGRWDSLKLREKSGTVKPGKEAVRKARRAFWKEYSVFLIVQVTLTALLSKLWRKLQGKDEPEDKVKGYIEDLFNYEFDPVLDTIYDTLAEQLTIIPLVGSVWENIRGGYETTGYIYDMVNTGIDTVGAMGDLFLNVVDGKEIHWGSRLNSIFDGLGMLNGIPTRNMRNIMNACVNVYSMISGDTSLKYTVDSWQYKPNYVDDLNAAIDAGDERLAETVADMLMVDRVGSSVGSEAAGEIVSLYASGETGVLPSKIGNKITVSINDESREIELTAAEQRELRAEYGKATSAVRRMVSTSAYSRLTTSERAVAVRDMNRLYMDRAKAKLHGADMTTAVAMTCLMSEGKYICAYAHIKAIKADKSIKNKATQIKRWLRSQGLSVAEQRAILYASGYRSEENLAAVKRLLRSASLSAKEKAAVRAALSIE